MHPRRTDASGGMTLPTLLLLLIAAACAGGAPPSDTPFQADGREPSIQIFVTNLNFMDATLWALTPGTREKLGVVTGKRQGTFTLPWRFPTDLRIEIDILAGPRCTTEALPVDSGDHIELIIDVEMLNSPLCGGAPLP